MDTGCDLPSCKACGSAVQRAHQGRPLALVAKCGREVQQHPFQVMISWEGILCGSCFLAVERRLAAIQEVLDGNRAD